MIAEWFYNFTIIIGRNLNRALGIADDIYEENVITGVMAIWFFLIILVLISICSFCMLYLSTKEHKKDVNELVSELENKGE